MPERVDLRIGIDVGGTNTDVVVLDSDGALVAKAKVATTEEASEGIAAGIDSVLSTVEAGRVTHVMLGTTHATNAVLTQGGLRKTAVIRIGAPATLAVPPLFGWPDDLRRAVSAGETIVPGGIEVDGREIASFDAEAVRRFLESLPERPPGVAITSVFASVSPVHELAAAEAVEKVLGDVDISLSHEIGSLGLLERENATVLNAALADAAREMATALGRALQAHGLSPVASFAQNDGTLMSLDHALRFPVLTIGSGPANSLRGAAYLTGTSDVLVMDVGGTSTDVGALSNGFPRESSLGAEIGGVRTNFRMPDLVSIALGGGTVVGGKDGSIRVGPESVGHHIGEEALVFGGQVPTLTDAAVAAGRAQVGTTRVTGHGATLREGLAIGDSMLADAVDRIKLSPGDQPLVVVGGGSILVPTELEGVSRIDRPEHAEVANAIGAAVASVSGQIDKVVRSEETTRERVLDELRREACERAIHAGADPDAVEVVEIEEIPLAYVTTSAVRVRVRAVGPLGGV